MQACSLSHWLESTNHDESLAVALRAIIAEYGVVRDYEEFVAVLGLGAATIAVPAEPLADWACYARDTALETAAELYGVRLRPLHPPAASAGLSSSTAFAQHFHDSYAPLIKEALQHEQLVLAWRGWPPPRDPLWGVITHCDDDTLLGYTLWHDGQPLPLTGPALQVYVVESVDSAALESASPSTLFRHVRCTAITAWDKDWAPIPGVISGAAAYETWAALLRKGDVYGPGAPPLFRQHCQTARRVTAARTALATWLRTIGEDLHGSQMRTAAHWANVCDQTVELLAPITERDNVAELLTNAAGVEHVCHALEEVCRLETALAADLSTLK